MSDTLYDRDILLWSEQQAETLQRLADGERVNDAIDWPHLIDEVLDVGRSQFNSVQSLLEQALVHLLKLRLWPDDPAADHWRSEAAAFLSGATRRFSPSMRQRIEVPELFGDAVRQLRNGGFILETDAICSAACPYAIDDLLSNRTVAELAALLPIV